MTEAQSRELSKEYKEFMLFAEVFTRTYREPALSFTKMFEIVWHLYNKSLHIQNLESKVNPIKRKDMQFVSYCDADGNLVDINGKPIVRQ